MNSINLLDHQKLTLDWMISRSFSNENGGIIHLEMGLGKTLLALYFSYLKLQSNPEGKILVVVPKILVEEWKRCYEKFFPKNSINILFASTKKNLPSTFDFSILITTYNVLISLNKDEEHYQKYISPNVVSYNGKNKYIKLPKLNSSDSNSSENFSEISLYDIVWDIIIADESQNFANSKTKLFEYVISLKGRSKWCLSGTPIKNYNTDIWSQLRFCGFDTIKTAKDWSLRCDDDLLKEEYMKYIFTLKYQDTNITLPLKNEHLVITKFDDEYTKNYLAILGETKKAINDYEIGDISYVNVLAKFTKLRFATLYNSRSENTPPKIKEILKILDNDRSREQAIIFCSSAKFLFTIKKYLGENGYSAEIICGETEMDKRNKFVEDYKKSKIQVLLLTYKVGGEGLNLTNGTKCIFCDQWWNPSVQQQALARIWRIGQSSDVDIYHLLAVYNDDSIMTFPPESPPFPMGKVKKSIDFKVMEVAKKKNKMASEMLTKNEKLDMDTLKFFIS